ncbi:uncharacterized protein LOC115767079 [Drosophila novamexicana]|uniref:uncharacterized protein LOC115767079 n=1 Tax=Drosophila novamexicana TaxID=47314 RepID=UPI0011E5DF18|nr:uncharacterized protein LOC115767079 [Drosophila novamexicana]XP_030567084.1 uncharacterized protein LOC115767079 [Drosophila novamexicana]XP_030567085.1 uncharacterized protein LOC115767079 [Drosophila novamexicana]
MRAGKKTEAEIGKTRPCIVYIKNLKESEATEIINAATSSKPTKKGRIAAAKQPTRRTHIENELEQERDKPRATRTSRRATTIANVELLPKNKQTAVVGATPIATRTRNAKGEPTTVPRAAAKTTTKQQVKAVATPLSKRRNTALILPVAGTCTPLSKRRDTTTRDIVSEPNKTKMYKQSKIAATAVATPPPTIAASRSRRSIKPNPKYASDDMVTPKYVAALASESTNKRSVKHLFANDDDEDEDMHDLIEEDNDDELADAAFNPQLHKSDDDDDISEQDFELQLRREKVPPKRGRGRPPKSASAATASSNTPSQAGRGSTQTGRGGVTHLQQLRRTIAPNLARSHMKVMATPTVGNKRKLEDANDTPIARKRMATEAGGVARSAPAINGSTSVTKASAISLASNQAKPKVVVGSSSSSSNNNNSSGSGSGLRMVQATAAKPRPASNFKLSTATATTRNAGGAAVPRTGIVGRPPSSTNALKVQKAATAVSAAAASMKSTENDDVPTFTIVNIDDIINQDDVLITRSSNSNSGGKKLLTAARNNNNSSRTNQSTSSPTVAIGSSRNSSSTPGNNLTASSTNKRLKAAASTTGTGTGTATTTASAGTTTNKHTLALNHNKQTSLVVSVGQTKPRPRILNAEMGKKTQPMMKPLMSMGKELCPMTDGGDTEDEDISNELAEDDMHASPPPATTNQARVVRRVQTAKWLPYRRHVLSTTTSVNASNNQRHHQQQQQQQLASGPDRKLTKLLGESSDDDVFKKPASPSTSTPSQRRYKENATDEEAATAAAEPETEAKQPKYFPPETTTYCQEDGRLVKKITCYETWHVISTPKEPSSKTRQQRTCLELPLVKLANVAARIKVPSTKWTSKVTLYKLSPSLMQRQTMTIFTGDLKTYNIPEEERHKYQPSCVLFRRSVLDRSKCRVPFDRAIIFKNKCFYANIEGKHVNLLGAPEVVNSVKDVEILIDIVDSLALSSDLVEMVTSK